MWSVFMWVIMRSFIAAAVGAAGGFPFLAEEEVEDAIVYGYWYDGRILRGGWGFRL